MHEQGRRKGLSYAIVLSPNYAITYEMLSYLLLDKFNR